VSLWTVRKTRKSFGPAFSTIVGSMSVGNCCRDFETLSRTSFATASRSASRLNSRDDAYLSLETDDKARIPLASAIASSRGFVTWMQLCPHLLQDKPLLPSRLVSR